MDHTMYSTTVPKVRYVEVSVERIAEYKWLEACPHDMGGKACSRIQATFGPCDMGRIGSYQE